MDTQQYLIVVLICISLLMHNVEYLFITLFAICLSSLMRCLLKSLTHFLNCFFIFLLLSFKSTFYILGNSLLSDVSSADILPPVCGLSSFLDIVLFKADVFNFNEVQFIHYFFHGSCLWCCTYSILLPQ